MPLLGLAPLVALPVPTPASASRPPPLSATSNRREEGVNKATKFDQNDRSPLRGSAAAAAIRVRSPEARKRSPSSGLKAGLGGGILTPAPEPAAAAVARPRPPDASARSGVARAVRTSEGFNQGGGGNGGLASGFAGVRAGVGEADADRAASGAALTPATEDASAAATGPCRSGPALGSLRASRLVSARATLWARAESDAGSAGSSALSPNRAAGNCAGGASPAAKGSKVSTTSGRSASEPRTVRRGGASFTGAAATTKGVASRRDRRES